MGDSRKQVLTVGGANAEKVLTVGREEFRLGAKHTIGPQGLQPGGSSVNHSCRLLAAGAADVQGIFPITRDGPGEVVAEGLRVAAKTGGTESKFDWIEGDDLATPFTTILAVGAERTVVNEFPDGTILAFSDHLDARVRAVEDGNWLVPDAVMVGHIHADRTQIAAKDAPDGRDHPGFGGALTMHLVDRLRALPLPDGTGRPFLFANFGGSQYRHGCRFWERKLRQVDCFQLDINEMRRFCEPEGHRTIENILGWFADRCTVIITMERMGAVGQARGSGNVVIAWPYDVEIKDTTGAGDAFGAGVVAAVLAADSGTRLAGDGALKQAMEVGRTWGAYACQYRGGASDCPSEEQLRCFQEAGTDQPTGKGGLGPVTVLCMDQARPWLRMFDRVFPFEP